MKTERVKAVLELIKEDSFVTSDELSSHLNVSKKTIQTLIKSINYEEEKYGVFIVSKKHYGYHLQVKDSKKYRDFMLKGIQDPYPKNAEERMYYIALQLLKDPVYVKIEDLAEQMYVSNSTMASTIKSVKEYLKEFRIDLQSKPNYGIRINGSEFDIRQCMVKCLKNYRHVKHESIIDTINQMLNDLLAKEGYSIAGISRDSLVMHLFVSVMRMQKGFFLDANHQFSTRDEKNVHVASLITKYLENAFAIKIPENERNYITVQLTCRQNWGRDDTKSNMVYNQQILDLVQEMLLRVKDTFGLDLMSDIELQMNLCQHIIPLKERLKYGFSIENPLLEDIRKEYPFAFEIATLASAVLYEQYLRKMSEDEIGYIALSFALALEKRNKDMRKNILLVCGTGRGSTRLLELKVKQLFGNSIKTIQTCDVKDVLNYDYQDIDYIFTTVTIQDFVPVPIVEMPVFLNEENVVEIKHQFEKQDQPNFLNYFSSELFYSDIRKDQYEEILKELCNKIVEQGYAQSSLYEYVMEREHLGKTTFMRAIALPHPTVSVSDKTFVAIAVLKEPVEWGNDLIQIIFLVSWSYSKTERLDGLYKGIYHLFSKRKNIQSLIQKPCFETFKEIAEQIEG